MIEKPHRFITAATIATQIILAVTYLLAVHLAASSVKYQYLLFSLILSSSSTYSNLGKAGVTGTP